MPGGPHSGVSCNRARWRCCRIRRHCCLHLPKRCSTIRPSLRSRATERFCCCSCWADADLTVTEEDCLLRGEDYEESEYDTTPCGRGFDPCRSQVLRARPAVA